MNESEEVLPDWLFRLINNLGVYLIALALGYFALRTIKKYPEPEPGSGNVSDRVIRFFFYGRPQELSSEDPDLAVKKNGNHKPTETLLNTALRLLFCVTGLLGSFLTWGLLQERIMTTEYETGRFESANFTVFCSRSFGWLIAFMVVNFSSEAPLRAPFYKFSFTSFSNVMSSYCQLEALKYLSFPTQVLGKSSKLIPVMIMGKILSNKKYPWYEYMVAVFVLIGVGTFMIAEKENKDSEKTTSAAGLILLIGYLGFDSFTSQWQGKLFKEYKMSSYQMMLGVNSFSASFTLLSLFQSGEFFTSIDFVTHNLDCMRDIVMFSAAGATGSMFIFYTIKTFGPLVFTMIMVTRQLIAIILSCIFYGHSIGPMGVFGAIIVFSSIGFRIYKKNTDK